MTPEQATELIEIAHVIKTALCLIVVFLAVHAFVANIKD